jgi:type III pantothenate kinase
MNLIVELGNTSWKLAIFDEGEMITQRSCQKLTVNEIRHFCSKYTIHRAMLSSVVKVPKPLYNFLLKNYSLSEFGGDTRLPLVNRYETPANLGRDRLACALAGACMFPGSPVLTVDAGTCIKFDFVTAEGEYLGGAISPGIQMRLQSMHILTAKLPLVKPVKSVELIGKNTKGSLLSGAINGALAEVDGIIDRYRMEFKELQVVLTGGDMVYFEGKLKNRIFAEPHLVLQGLNQILEYNAAR